MKQLLFILVALLLAPSIAFASDASHQTLNLTAHWVGYAAIAIFVIAYTLVILEEQLHLRKSKPVLLAAGLIWILIAFHYSSQGMPHSAEVAIRHNFLEYAELFFFLLVAMTYINAMLERNVFDSLRDWLVAKGYSYKTLFWLTGILAFFISPVADNLTTALIMCAVVIAVGKDEPKFIGMSCINIVVGANAGGAFSPFGDITTLMVWQKGMVEFNEFFALFIPAVVNFFIPAFIMQFFLPKGNPSTESEHVTSIKQGGLVIVGLFLLTIITAVSFHTFINLPPVYGMMLGLAYLKFFAYYLRRSGQGEIDKSDMPTSHQIEDDFDIFDKIAKAEWDTLFFFYGVILAVGGLGFIGYLGITSEFMYGQLGATNANILVGILSAIVDNIPVMFAVLTMNPDMSHMQWLLVTLTAGVGGSLLSIGSAAGVALMGQARGYYTFFSHLKWTPVIALGYAASIYTHLLING
ncbi:sodium:proton antiporter NhaD [Colwellia sp. 4_MG-2023]|jgi:NhaD family Na+/H+ antiporter|uniref:sodium:proton antiporter NhaD n=1 Tax=unclassified Colwellia TaxID=196834 RepID=UPI001C083A59|nr:MULTISPECIES: sodium:proton antiporter NhaD [unclassified Colwellia]MBU2926529.1 sodium:proton antiporter NhaD [Colwellia sp. C2M11]MDO6487488.1 sodium:proton antiporter NhaD [Colwellia sp. 6_MG-2023]MDO6507602.1 sodium:proton antiporter NhaD [Colwellia sp. 5_MG-2023]MDO6556437.1 sodium:proton antiporter NhaD [Colwellia sp. 4_MG-2023]MDO6652567.1 sodium:proton antiporter NhaD [Colwellia sp. 3_MG-2023]